MMKKLLLLLIPCVSTVFCEEAENPVGFMEASRRLDKWIAKDVNIAILFSKNFKKGCEAMLDFHSPETKEAALNDMEEYLKWGFGMKESLEDGDSVDKVKFEKYKDTCFRIIDTAGSGSLMATLMVTGLGCVYPRWFINNVTQNKVGRVVTRAVFAPFGLLQGFGADCYVKCLSADDNHRMLAWSKVVAWTGDGF